MKKTYKAPTTKVRIIAVHQMLCTSNPNALMGTSDNDAVGSDNNENNLSKEDGFFGW